jgi:DNA invertase Pin-like site-specific DNA recombinase
MAVLAEEERRMISARTTAALAAAKAQGAVLGCPIAAETVIGARKAWSKQARASAAPLKLVIKDIQAAGVTSLTGIATALEARGIKTPRGNKNWHARQVARLLAS